MTWMEKKSLKQHARVEAGCRNREHMIIGLLSDEPSIELTDGLENVVF